MRKLHQNQILPYSNSLGITATEFNFTLALWWLPSLNEGTVSCTYHLSVAQFYPLKSQVL